MTPKRASSTSAIWWLDKAHYQRASAREERHESGCGRLFVDGRMARLGGDATAAVVRGARPGRAESPHMLRNVQPRGAGGGTWRDRQGRRRWHAHTRIADTTPAPEERHCALSQPSLNERSARHPARIPFHSRTLLPRWPSSPRRRLHSFQCALRERSASLAKPQGHANYQSDR